MNATISTVRLGRRALALCALAGVFFAALLGLAAADADAAYTARVDAGTLRITGNGASDKLVLGLQPGSPTTLQVDVGADGTAEYSFDRSTFTAIDVQAAGGNDEVLISPTEGGFPEKLVTVSGGLGADTLLGGYGAETLDGGSGADTLAGSLGADVLIGGVGDDVVSGHDGDDRALLGGGNDRFTWNPGDDNDIVDGEGGTDLLDFFGASIGELIEVSANGPRVLFTRNIASVVTDLDNVERVGYHALGGADTVVVNDLAGTDARSVEVDLNLFGGGGDGQPDNVIARGTAGADRVTVASPGGVLVSGLFAQVQVAGSEVVGDAVSVETLAGADTISMSVGVFGPESINFDGGLDADTATYNGTAAGDTIDVVSNGLEVSTVAPATARLDTIAESLVVLGLGGADTTSALGNLAALTALTMDGGEADDVLRGGNGADLLIGGNGNDALDGNQGADRALGGGGNDRFQWDPGDGNDVVEGQSGDDLLDFFGSSIGEIVDVSANGRRARLTRNIANITMDIDGVESVAVHVLGGADTLAVGDLSGTSVKTVYADLGTFAGTGDGEPDTVVTNGTSRGDVVQVTRSGSEVLVGGLPAQTTIYGGEALADTLRVQTLDGNDDITVAPDVSELIALIADLGTGE